MRQVWRRAPAHEAPRHLSWLAPLCGDPTGDSFGGHDGAQVGVGSGRGSTTDQVGREVSAPPIQAPAPGGSVGTADGNPFGCRIGPASDGGRAGWQVGAGRALMRVAFARRIPDTQSLGSRFWPIRNPCPSARHTELAHLLEVDDLCRANSEPDTGQSRRLDRSCPGTPVALRNGHWSPAHCDAPGGRIAYRIAGPAAVSVAPSAQDCSAACASRRASSAGALIIGQ
jgi:hypothetical protein